MFTRLVLSILLGCAPVVYAGSGQFNYKGILKDSTGTPVADSCYLLRCAFYDSPIDGNLFWQSSGYVPIFTINGEYECMLGVPNPVPDSLSQFNNLWLSTAVEEKKEMLPRVAIQYSDLVPVNNPCAEGWADGLKIIKTEQVSSLDPGYSSSEDDRSAGIPRSNTNQNKARIRWSVARVGWDLGGSFGVGSRSSYNVSQGLSLSLEIDGSDNPGFGLFGLGAELVTPRSYEYTDHSFGYVSFYVAGKINPLSFKGKSDFLLICGKGGYGLIYGDDYFIKLNSTKGGLYYGAGLGLVVDEVIIIEAMYTVNQQGLGLGGGDKADTKYSRINVSLGMVFRWMK